MVDMRRRFPSLAVRLAAPADDGVWIRLREALWPGSADDHRREIAEYFRSPRLASACLVAELSAVGVVGFAEVGLRPYAEGCRSSPVGYLEGIFVAEPYRARGVGTALVEAAEQWARDRGCTEMASDRELDNEGSGIFHAAVGYQEVERIVCFRKPL
jgi:aminoglycoside 6'-N-acetyltransferase I